MGERNWRLKKTKNVPNDGIAGRSSDRKEGAGPCLCNGKLMGEVSRVEGNCGSLGLFSVRPGSASASALRG